MILGKILRPLLAKRGMTQSELARAANISVPYLSELMTKDKSPGVKIIDRIAAALDVTIDDLIHPQQATIKNCDIDKATGICCVRCKSRSDLIVLPHRFGNVLLCGLVFVCRDCAPITANAVISVTYQTK